MTTTTDAPALSSTDGVRQPMTARRGFARLRAAREGAGLSRATLARALRVSPARVRYVETAAIVVSYRYVFAVLRACGLEAEVRALRAGRALS